MAHSNPSTTTYYAMANAPAGSIVTVRLDADSADDAVSIWAEQDGSALWDAGRTDLEDDLGFDGSEMDDEAMEEAAGAKFVRELETGKWRLVAVAAQDAAPFAVGDRVCGGEPGTEDYDEGTVLAIDGERIDLVLCESPDGWSLHAPGSTDEDIATGDAPYLVCGEGEPTDADYRAAIEKLREDANR